MAIFCLYFLKLSILISLYATLSSAVYPSPCSYMECPSYKLIHTGVNYEIRNYTSIVLVSTSPISNKSFVKATKIGVKKLTGYIQGKNKKTQKIEQTALVVTQVGQNSIVVSFYIPKKYQAHPPLAKGLHIQKIRTTYAAVRQFHGLVTNEKVKDEVSALIKSVSGTKYGHAINKTHGGAPAKNYFVGEYSAPYEHFDKTNEIWLTFHHHERTFF